MPRNLRVTAYAVCVRDDQILLARSPGPDGTPEWVLPGGGMEHGEDPYDTVRRECAEETGYRIEVTGLLGVDSHRLTLGRAARTDHHALRLVYEGAVVGGELRYEVGGSTGSAAWQDLSAIPDLHRVAFWPTPRCASGPNAFRARPSPCRGPPLPGQVNDRNEGGRQIPAPPVTTEWTLRLLALPDADHPGYREERRPRA